MGVQQLFAVAVSAGALLGGIVSTYCYDRRAPLPWRLPAALCTGLAALGLIGFLLALQFGLTARVVALAGVATASPIGLLFVATCRRAFWDDLTATARAIPQAASRASLSTIARAGVYALGAVLLWRVAERVMFVRADGIYTGVSHNIGDLPFHLSITNRFLWGNNFPPEHPSFAGTAFTYSYLSDVIAGMFVTAGVPVQQVFVWSTWLLCLSLAALLYYWTLSLTESRDAAFLAPILTLLSGGLGWWLWVSEATASEGVLASLARLPHDYTITYDNQFRWGNIVTTLLVTQRGLLLGMPLAVIVFQQWWRAVAPSDEGRRDRIARMVAAGVVAGLLPLVHAHTYAVVLGVGACQALLFRDRALWVPFFAAALALGLPQAGLLTYASGVRAGSMAAWSVGWDHGIQNVLLFWLKNTGLLIPLVLIAVGWRGSRALLSRPFMFFYMPFTLCFLIPNLFRLSPWIWDNIKILIYWFIASVPVIALLLARAAQGGPWRRVLTSMVLVSLTLAGALDLWRVASNAFESRVFDREGIDFAAMVSQNTNPQSLIVHAPTYDHPVVLTGRRSFMGYPGHVWSHGLDPGPREAEIRTIYAGGAASEELLARYHVDYVVVGPLERRQMQVDEPFFERFPTVDESGGYRLHRVTHVEP